MGWGLWFSQIDASGGAVFFASGVFYYFLTEQVKALVQSMAGAFPGGVLVFDAANRTAVKMIAKNMAQNREDQRRGRVFRRFRCAQGDRRVGQPFAGHEPRLYAGL